MVKPTASQVAPLSQSSPRSPRRIIIDDRGAQKRKLPGVLFQSVGNKNPIIWVAVKELKINSHNVDIK